MLIQQVYNMYVKNAKFVNTKAKHSILNKQG